jgi:hypothetical protein
MPEARSCLESPTLDPGLPVVRGFERHEAVQRKLNRHILASADEEGQESGQVMKVAGDQNVSRLSAKTFANPLGRVVGL